jgi:type-F conjugative transfer system pilin assembly protein TrbC
MPEASLKSLAEEAPKHNAVLVMRGLYEDSFVKTARKLKDLNLTIDIHPDLFENHKITSVPTFIELKDNKPAQRLSGNVSLSFCVSKFKEHS